MDAKTYVKNVLVTEARDFGAVQQRLMDIQNIRLIHAAAGIASEIAEVIELNMDFGLGGDVQLDRVNLMEEMSDLLWYVGVACDALGCVEEVTANPPCIESVLTDDRDLCDALTGITSRLGILSGEFIDKAIKKTVFYGKTVNHNDLVEHLREIHNIVTYCLQFAGYTVEHAREINIAKLKARYGDKFTEAAALNRDLDNERKILESK